MEISLFKDSSDPVPNLRERRFAGRLPWAWCCATSLGRLKALWRKWFGTASMIIVSLGHVATAQLNTSHTGLKRILVGEGITLEVRNAQEVSLFHALDLGLQVNRSVVINKEMSEFWPLQHSLCEPLLSIHISGSVTVAAYRDRNRNSYIEAAFLSRDTVELLPEKCYVRNIYKKERCPIASVNQRIAIMEKILRSLLGKKIYQNGSFSFLKANIKASNVVRFKMELERDIKSNETLQGTLADWRTRPTVERVWFEVVAGVEGERLKPLVIKKVRPFVEVDSYAWSNLMSNISFTKFPSILVPPEPLTLDVKW